GVQLLLVETYVDRSTHTGCSLVAANWLRIGQSQGRGRSTPRKTDQPRSLKDVWVWQWDPKARTQLQERTLPPGGPRSVFSCPKLSWVEEELDGLDLGHITLKRRFARMLEGRWAKPDQSFFSSLVASRVSRPLTSSSKIPAPSSTFPICSPPTIRTRAGAWP